MRIIAGSRRGKKLAPLKGDRTRPTADRVKESMFNIIAGFLDQAVVLDLYAGTGALGIEALSRGAEMAVFIDRDPSAVATLHKNIRACRFEDKSRVIRWDVSKDLTCLQPAAYRFDVVFMDPPYGKGLISPTLSNLKHQCILLPETLIVVEHSDAEPIDFRSGEFRTSDQRRYGKTLVSFFTCML